MTRCPLLLNPMSCIICFVLALDEGDIALLKTYVSLFKWLQKLDVLCLNKNCFYFVFLNWLEGHVREFILRGGYLPQFCLGDHNGLGLQHLNCSWSVHGPWEWVVVCRRCLEWLVQMLVYLKYTAKLDLNGKFKCLDICYFSWVWWLTPFAQHSALSQVWGQLGADHVQVRKCRTAVGHV